MPDETIFDKILKGEIPSHKVYEDDIVLAFNDIEPQAPIHVLVIPKKKIQFFHQLKDKEAKDVGDFFQGVSRVACELGLDQDGYRVVLNCGDNGLQTVDYLHAHILGERKMTWPPG